uniref:Uncharacterized protein n=1 Tax=Lactuca sativa TaxID=4236 RepID=A0A9R1XF65_LACSA|nr:hypothetical protein LSAT_V11C500271880 [Lactuca sativa]
MRRWYRYLSHFSLTTTLQVCFKAATAANSTSNEDLGGSHSQFNETNVYITGQQVSIVIVSEYFITSGRCLKTFSTYSVWYVESGSLTESLWDTSTVSYPYPNNGMFVREYTIKLLGASFPNIPASESVISQSYSASFASYENLEMPSKKLLSSLMNKASILYDDVDAASKQDVSGIPILWPEGIISHGLLAFSTSPFSSQRETWWGKESYFSTCSRQIGRIFVRVQVLVEKDRNLDLRHALEVVASMKSLKIDVVTIREAVGKVLPELNGKLTGMDFRILLSHMLKISNGYVYDVERLDEEIEATVMPEDYRQKKVLYYEFLEFGILKRLKLEASKHEESSYLRILLDSRDASRF